MAGSESTDAYMCLNSIGRYFYLDDIGRFKDTNDEI